MSSSIWAGVSLVDAVEADSDSKGSRKNSRSVSAPEFRRMRHRNPSATRFYDEDMLWWASFHWSLLENACMGKLAPQDDCPFVVKHKRGAIPMA